MLFSIICLSHTDRTIICFHTSLSFCVRPAYMYINGKFWVTLIIFASASVTYFESIASRSIYIVLDIMNGVLQ